VENFTGYRLCKTKPIVGDNVFTQTSRNTCRYGYKIICISTIYFQNDFKRKNCTLRENIRWESIIENLQELGPKLNQEDLKSVTQRIIELGDKKKQ
jgi:D-citramalate synthase